MHRRAWTRVLATPLDGDLELSLRHTLDVLDSRGVVLARGTWSGSGADPALPGLRKRGVRVHVGAQGLRRGSSCSTSSTGRRCETRHATRFRSIKCGLRSRVHPQGAPAGRIGFSWQPCNRVSADTDVCEPNTVRNFVAELDAISARLARAIQNGYRERGASAVGACRPEETEVELDWCDGRLGGAAFTDIWSIFRRWG